MSNKATFETAVLFVLKNEGGYTHDKADSGGITNYGITIKEYSHYLGRRATSLDMRNMPILTAEKIYRQKYWIPEYERLDQTVATVIFDWTVLHGVISGRMDAQRCCNKLGTRLHVDGIFGEATIAAINAVKPAYFVQSFVGVVKAWMRERAHEKPSQRVFLAGWLKRADRMALLA